MAVRSAHKREEYLNTINFSKYVCRATALRIFFSFFPQQLVGRYVFMFLVREYEYYIRRIRRKSTTLVTRQIRISSYVRARNKARIAK